MAVETELIAGEFKRGESALARARLTFHDGAPTVDLRVFVRLPDGTLRPTPSGITLPRSKTRELCPLVRALGQDERASRPQPDEAGEADDDRGQEAGA